MATDTTATVDETDPEGPAEPASVSLWERIDRRVYGVEQAVITGALLVMTLTYFLQIVHREMQAEVSAFDRLFLEWAGYPTIQEVPAETLATVTGWVTPLVLAAMTFVMGIFAARTRSRQGLEEGESPAPLTWGKRFGAGLLVCAVCWAFVALVASVSARWVCLFALVATVGPALKKALAERQWARLAGTLLGGGIVGWFFLVKVDEGYIWGVELSSVLLMYVGFFGASMATREQKHIQVDALRRKIPLKWLNLYNAAGGLITVCTCLLLLVLAGEFVLGQAEHGNRLEATQLPELVVSLPIALAMVMMAIRFGVQTAGYVAAHLRGELAARPEAGSH